MKNNGSIAYPVQRLASCLLLGDLVGGQTQVHSDGCQTGGCFGHIDQISLLRCSSNYVPLSSRREQHMASLLHPTISRYHILTLRTKAYYSTTRTKKRDPRATGGGGTSDEERSTASRNGWVRRYTKRIHLADDQ